MYTHICIKTPDKPLGNVYLKKGDYCTLVSNESNPRIRGGIAYRLEEDIRSIYSAHLFLPLPPQTVKTVYVAIDKEVEELIQLENVN